MNDREREVFNALLSCGLDREVAVSCMKNNDVELLPYKTIKEWIYNEYSCGGMLDVNKVRRQIEKTNEEYNIKSVETPYGVVLYSIK